MNHRQHENRITSGKEGRRAGLPLVLLCVLTILAFFALRPVPSYAAKQSKQPKLSKTKVTLCVGGRTKLRVKNCKEKVTWRSSNSYVAKVSRKGVVTSRHGGYAVIFAKADGKELKCRVTVRSSKKEKPFIFCKEADIDGSTVTCGKTYELYIMGGYGKKWKWKISDPELAKLEKGGNYVSSLKRSGKKSVKVKTYMGKSGTVRITARSGSKILRFRLVIHASSKDIAYISLRQKVLASVIRPEMTAENKCLALAKWLSDYASYKVTNAEDYSLLTTRKGQCYHYARTYEFLLEGTGIECECVCTKRHAWNQVKIDGSWYNIDVSSFDTGISAYPYDYKYFLVSDEAFWRKEVRYKPCHSCVSTKYDTKSWQ